MKKLLKIILVITILFCNCNIAISMATEEGINNEESEYEAGGEITEKNEDTENNEEQQNKEQQLKQNIENNENNESEDEETEVIAVATIGENKYETLSEAIGEASEGDIVVLADNIVLNTAVNITKSIKLDLNGKQISSAIQIPIRIGGNATVEISNGTIYSSMSSGTAGAIYIASGDVTIDECTITVAGANSALYLKGGNTVVKNSKLSAGNLTVLSLDGSIDLIGTEIDNNGGNYGVYTASDSGLEKTITINKGTTVKNAYFAGVGILDNNATVNVYGNLSGHYYGLSTNGTYSNVTVNVYEGANIVSESWGMYLPAKDSTANIYGGNIEGEQTALEIRAGNLNIYGGTFTSTVTENSWQKNGSGTTISGAAIAVSPHTTDNDIMVLINGGIFNANVPVYERNTDPENCTGNVTINILAGVFNSNGEETVKCIDCTEVISGGKYTHDVSEYAKDEYGCVLENEYYVAMHVEHTATEQWIIEKVPTTTELGSKYKKCVTCGEILLNEEIPMLKDDGNTSITDENSGTVSKDVIVAEDAPVTKLNNNISELREKVLNLSDEEQIINKNDINIYLEIEKAEEKISEEDKEKIMSMVNDGVEPLFLDINLYKQIEENEAEKVAETNGKISITVVLPEELLNTDEKVLRSYKIVFVHDGEVYVIENTEFDADKNELTFETDKFSYYAVTYEDIDIKDEDNTNQENNGENNSGDADSKEENDKNDESENENKENINNVEGSANISGSSNPYTGDNVMNYVVLLTVSILMLVGIVIIIKKQQK